MRRVVLHLGYTTPEARRLLLVRALGESWARLAALRWYAVDLPVTVPGGAADGLEVVADLPSAGDDDAAIAREAAGWAGADLVNLVRRAEGSLMLQTALFPGGAVPAVYAEVLAAGTARARVLLDRSAPVPKDAVARELLATYTAFFPREAARRAALHLYADWLEEIAAQQGITEAGGPDEAFDLPLPGMAVPAAKEYLPLRGRLAGHVTRLLRRHAAPPEHMDEARRGVYAQLVARAAHIQVVRLLGPHPEGGLRTEARRLRRLAGGLGV